MKTRFVPEIRLLLTIVAAMSIVVVAEWRARSTLSQPTEPLLQRPSGVQFFHRTPSVLPPISAAPSLLLIGNSHTYALPGLQKGDVLRDGAWASRPILLDAIGERLRGAHPEPPATCYALAYPNFLPYEMLTRVAHAYHHGFRPNLVVLGVTWRNVARDSQLRHAVRDVYREADFADTFRKMLFDGETLADREILDAIAVDVRRTAAEIEKERVRSDADQIDDQLADWIGQQLTLLGESGNLRAQFFLNFTGRVQDWIIGQGRTGYAYDVVEHDLRFNLKCLLSLLRLFKQQGATVVCYLAPERTDVPPLMDPARERKFISEFEQQTAPLGVVVLDARRVVPNEFWGWNGDVPDDSHFTEPGHKLLGQFLVREMDRRHLLAALTGTSHP